MSVVHAGANVLRDAGKNKADADLDSRQEEVMRAFEVSICGRSYICVIKCCFSQPSTDLAQPNTRILVYVSACNVP